MNSPTGSASTHSPDPLDDPFPELSQCKLAPVSARFYSCFEDTSSPRSHVQSRTSDDVISVERRVGTPPDSTAVVELIDGTASGVSRIEG